MPKFKKNPGGMKPSGFKMNYTDGKKASPQKFFGGFGLLGGKKKGRGLLSRAFDPLGLHEKGGVLSGVPKPFGHLRGEKGIGGWKGGMGKTLIERGDHSIGNVVADATKVLSKARKKHKGKGGVDFF